MKDEEPKRSLGTNGGLSRMLLYLMSVLILSETVKSVKHENNVLDYAYLKENANRNGHGLDGVGTPKEVKVNGNHTKPEAVVKKHFLYLKAVDTHSVNGLKPYRHYQQDKLRRENSKFLYEYLKEQERLKQQKNQKELKAMLGEALKILKQKTSDKHDTTKKLAKNSNLTPSRFLLQQLLLNLEKQSQKEASLLKSSHVTGLSKTDQMSGEKARILSWIEANNEKGLLDWDTAHSLSLFVKNHDEDLNHQHALQACPYLLLAQLIQESKQKLLSE